MRIAALEKLRECLRDADPSETFQQLSTIVLLKGKLYATGKAANLPPGTAAIEQSVHPSGVRYLPPNNLPGLKTTVAC